MKKSLLSVICVIAWNKLKEENLCNIDKWRFSAVSGTGTHIKIDQRGHYRMVSC